MKKRTLFLSQILSDGAIVVLLSVATLAGENNSHWLIAVSYFLTFLTAILAAFAVTAVLAAVFKRDYGGISIVCAILIYLADVLVIFFLCRLISPWL